MSYSATAAVLASGLTDGTQVSVLVALAYCLNDTTGLCCPSTATISKLSRRSVHVVRKAIQVMIEKGYITVDQKPGGVRSFSLFLDKLPEPVQIHTGVQIDTPVQKCTGGTYRTVRGGGTELYGEGVQNCTPNKEDNRELNKESNKEDSYAAIPPAPAAPKRRAAITHLLEITELPGEWRDYCAQVRPDLDPDRVWTSFRFYWTSGRGSGTRRSDKSWNSTWQTWVRKESESRAPHQETPEEFGKRIAREMQEEEMRRNHASL